MESNTAKNLRQNWLRRCTHAEKRKGEDEDDLIVVGEVKFP